MDRPKRESAKASDGVVSAFTDALVLEAPGALSVKEMLDRYSKNDLQKEIKGLLRALAREKKGENSSSDSGSDLGTDEDRPKRKIDTGRFFFLLAGRTIRTRIQPLPTPGHKKAPLRKTASFP